VIEEIAVVVPVRNEQDHLPTCIAALRRARARVAEIADVRVVLVLDDCTDGSERIAAAAGDLEIVRIAARNVGTARRTGVDHALARSSRPLRHIWIANTDADSVVPELWLTIMHEEVRRGAQLVLGMVVPTPGLTPSQQRMWRSHHVAVEGHPHVHGANLGIRADLYRALGGWPEVSTGEDEQLARLAAQTADARIVPTARHPVCTSSRLVARAPLGFAGYLRDIAAACSTVALSE
jgi:glycosyltransferase involved in cell wall biosynthesis